MRKAWLAAGRGKPFFKIAIIQRWTWILLAIALASAAARPAQATIASSILIDEGTGRILRAYRADSPHPPASLAKMMTLYLAFEALQQGRITLGSTVEVSFSAAAKAPSKLYLQPGQTVTVEQLILAMSVKSANDAAAAMAEFLAGSEAAFAQRMTAKARELGMRSTTFRNASGLPAAGAYTTARDMALLARALHSRFPKYAEYFSRRYFQWGARTFRNTNRLLHTRGEVDGMKTGYTRASGFNLVATAEYRNQRVILVVLGGRTSGQRYRHAETLLAAAYRGLPARPPANVAVAGKIESDDDDGDETAAAEAKAKAEKETAAAADKKKSSGFSLVSPAVASTRVRVPETSRGAVRYGIDLGSYRNVALARNAAKKAYYRVPSAYRTGSTRVAVVPIKRGRKVQYAARVLGFNQSAAGTVCRHLARRGQRCHTVSYGLTLAERHDKRYGVQIGVYRNLATARAKARKALQRMASADRVGTVIRVVKVRRGSAVRYVARLDGFRVEARADNACYRLERSGYDCNTVSYQM
jgi:D-alanyl-D-alanine carboxypeptidase